LLPRQNVFDGGCMKKPALGAGFFMGGVWEYHV
jgi:hypothetical protein